MPIDLAVRVRFDLHTAGGYRVEEKPQEAGALVQALCPAAILLGHFAATAGAVAEQTCPDERPIQ